MVRREEIAILQLNVFKFCCRSLNVRLYNKDSSKAEHACVEVRQSYDCFKVPVTETSRHTATLATLTQADHWHTWLLQFCILGFDTVACCAVTTVHIVLLHFTYCAVTTSHTALLHFTYCTVTSLRTTSHAVLLPLYVLRCYHFTYSAVTTSHTVLLPLYRQCCYHFNMLCCYHFTHCVVTTLHTVLLPL